MGTVGGNAINRNELIRFDNDGTPDYEECPLVTPAVFHTVIFLPFAIRSGTFTC
jgi:hypothetical protein